MGNRQSSKRRESQIVRPNLASAVNPSLPPEAVNTLANCLNRLPLVLDKRVRDEVIRRVELVETPDTPEILLRKGQEPSGIYVLVSGNVNVVSENEKYVLREIQAGDCFGEVSVLFNIKCTADVKTVNRCVILLLRTSDARQLFTFPSEVTLLQWFQQRRYFDTSKLFNSHQLSREIALDVLQRSPVLHGWKKEALDAVIKTVKPEIIMLYPANSIITKEGWKGQEIFILVHGQVTFSTGDQELATFAAGEKGFSFGEEGFFTGTERRSTVRSSGPCQVITLREENFHDAFSQFTAEASLLQELNVKWKQQVNQRDAELYTKYGGALDLEILRMTLKQTDEFQHCPPGFLYLIALSMVIKEVRADEAVLSKRQYQDGGTLFVVLQGSAEVMKDDISASHTVGLKQVFWKAVNMPVRGWVKATELCVAAVFPEGVVREAESTFPDVVLLRH
ncbi:unnamed protein product [Porites lobata]|uniref:Cyclic nucleotide-binding domain-containing protein n=1 Tax=Porites lobata TaxID=104759 RepID=A0ABN8NY29_9CNID|nr:unnamed protein product [Porites lobata]